MNSPRQHPFPVVAHLDRLVAVTFAFPEKVLRPLVPVGLEIETYKGLGFLTTALVWTRRFRPVGFPPFLGHDFFLTGYRVFTRLRDDSGRRLRGLGILGSETDRLGMAALGNLISGHPCRRVKARIETLGTETRVHTTRPDGTTTLDLTFDDRPGEIALPPGSPFTDWQAARRFAGPLPLTFSAKEDGSFLVTEGSRAPWAPRPIALESWYVSLFDQSPLRDTPPVAANAFAVDHIDYRWDRGRLVRPTPALA